MSNKLIKTVTEVSALPIENAPKDGTLIKLLVDYSGKESRYPLDDLKVAWTIGFNNLDNTEIDEWEMVGWNWSQDHFTNGKGKVIGWLPFF
jgi:hypothetical protein